MKKTRTRNYINNKDLYEALVNYNLKKKEVDNLRVPEYIGECILLIAKRLASKGNFANYSYKDEMIADGIENCLAVVDNFNCDRKDKDGNPVKNPNPFAYFTQIMWFAFLRRIQKEKRQHYLKLKNFKRTVAQQELDNLMPALYNPASAADDDVIDNYIKDYEDKIQAKKDKVITNELKQKKSIEQFYDE